MERTAASEVFSMALIQACDMASLLVLMVL
jgi:hypothetical protein